MPISPKTKAETKKCAACQGTGRSSKGGECYPCDGTGNANIKEEKGTTGGGVEPLRQ